MHVLLLKCLLLLLPIFAESTEIEDVTFDETYRRQTLPDGELSLFKYSLKYSVDTSHVVRVRLESENATRDSPVMAVFRETRSIVSAQLPITLQKEHHYNAIALVLCPFVGNDTGKLGDSDSLTVEVSSASSTPIEYVLNATLLDNFVLTIDDRIDLIASPSQPTLRRFEVDKNLDSVLVMVDSNDDICMTVSIQPLDECPVFDLDSNIFFSGIRQTMTKKAYIPVHRRILEKFYIVFVVRPVDKECSRNNTNVGESKGRMKSFSVTIEELPKDTDYWIPLTVSVAVFIVIYVVVFIYMYSMMKYDFNQWKKHGREVIMTAIQEAEDEAAAAERQQKNEQRDKDNQVDPLASDSNQLNEGDEAPEKEIARTKVDIVVSDLTMKSYKQLEKKYYLYAWNLVTIAMFYGLPVVQLVLVWQNTVNVSGDMDLCYFNFHCARPLFAIFAFNSVFSNTGYVFLGILFIIMVKEREIRHRKTVGTIEKTDVMEFGIPMHNGLMYALGIAITMEGVLSASYHICPSPSNYQFDTAFMYIMAALGVLKLYQLRHADINPNAHVGYALMALFILMAMCGVYFNDVPFYVGFSILYILIMIAINVEFYFNTVWSFDCGMFGRVTNTYRHVFTNCPRGLIPTYKGRFIFLLIADVFNFAFIIGGIVTKPKEFPSYLLLPFVGNLFLYLMYYIFMKKMKHEHLTFRCMLCLPLAFICWSVAIYFFLHNVADWLEMPAVSRLKNRDCILFDFYDNHDVWHFMSALSLFFSFSVFLSLDDDLRWVRRDTISVF